MKGEEWKSLADLLQKEDLKFVSKMDELLSTFEQELLMFELPAEFFDDSGLIAEVPNADLFLADEVIKFVEERTQHTKTNANTTTTTTTSANTNNNSDSQNDLMEYEM